MKNKIEDFFNPKIQDKYNAHLVEASKALKVKDYVKAIEALKASISIFPENVQPMGELCSCLSNLKRNEELIELAKRALAISQKRASKDNIGRFYSYIALGYKDLERYDLAIENYLRAIANKPYYVNNYFNLAICYYCIKDYEKSRKIFEKTREISPEFANEMEVDSKIDLVMAEENQEKPEVFHTRRAIGYEMNKNCTAALEEYKLVFEMNSNNVIALYGLFLNEKRLNNHKKAIEYGEKAIKIISEEKIKKHSYLLKAFFIALSDCCYAVEDYDSGEKYAKLFQCYEYLEEADDALQRSDNKKALECCKKAYDTYDSSFEAIDKTIETAFVALDFPSVMKFVEIGALLAKSQSDDERIGKYNSYVARCFLLIGKFNEAAESYEKAIQRTKDVSTKLEYSYKKAICYASIPDAKRALDQLTKSIEFVAAGAEDVYDIRSKIIEFKAILDPESDLNKATLHFNEGVRLFNEVKAEGQSSSNEYKLEQAIKESRLSLFYVPQDIEVLDLLNRCLFSVRRKDEAYNVSMEGFLVSRRDNDYRYFEMFCYNIANYYYSNLRDYEKALYYYQLAHEHNPEDKDNLYFIGACFRNLGVYEKAVEAFEKAYKIAPNDNEIVEQLALCKRLAGK